MKAFQSGLLKASAFFMLVPFFTSCASSFQGLSMKEVPNALYLSGDGRTAWLSQSAFTEEMKSRLSSGETITLVHSATGIKIMFPLLSAQNRYYFANYGGLLRKGDRVAVLFDGISPAQAILE